MQPSVMFAGIDKERDVQCQVLDTLVKPKCVLQHINMAGAWGPTQFIHLPACASASTAACAAA